MRYPTDNNYISSGYGWRTGIHGERNWHSGVDFPRPVHGNLYAILDGIVTENRWSTKGGWTLAIRFTDGVTGYYQHMRHRSALLVDQQVTEGAIVGVMGETGEYVQGVHLHFETWRNGASFDPAPYLAQGSTVGGGAIPFPPTTEPTTEPEPEEDDMAFQYRQYVADKKNEKGQYQRALVCLEAHVCVRFVEAGDVQAQKFREQYETGSSITVTESMLNALEAEVRRAQPRGEVAVIIAEADG